MIRLAIPMQGESFCEHFGRGDGFFLCDLMGDALHRERPRIVPRPKPRCESVPRWLRDMGVTTVLAGGIGAVARQHLQELGVRVSAGHRGADPEQIIDQYLAHPSEHKENSCATLEHRHRHCRG